MATEYEELQLRVTLVDEATPKLEPLLSKIKQFGGGEHAQAFKRLHENSKETTELFKMMGKGVGETAEKFLPLIRGAGGVAAAFVAVGFAAKKSFDAVKEFADEMTRLDQISRTIGLPVGMIKSMHEQMTEVGIAGEAADRAIQGIAKSIADLNQPGSQLRQTMAAMVVPRDVPEVLSRLTAIAHSEAPEAANKIRDLAETVRRLVTAQRGAEAGAAAAMRVYRQFGAEALAFMHGEFDKVDQDMLRRMEMRKQAARDFTKDYGGLSNALKEIHETFGAIMTDSQLMRDIMHGLATAARAIADGLHAVEDFLHRHRSEQPGAGSLLKSLPGFGPVFEAYDLTMGARNRSERSAQMMRWGRWHNFPASEVPAAAPSAAPSSGGLFMPGRAPWDNPLFGGGAQRFAGGGGGGGGDYVGGDYSRWNNLPLSRNIEDRRGEQALRDDTRSTEENTAQLKRLNDFLQMPPELAGLSGAGPAPAGSMAAKLGINSIRGGGGGGGGGAGGRYSLLGGGGVGMRGLGGLPGVGPRGGMLPHGNDSGPGVGPGAGGTPAGAGGAAGAGGDLDRGAYDKMFAGTPLAGHYEDVVKAAQANDIPPSLMAGVMAHETGRGTSAMLRDRNNPAGLMDPKTGMATGQTFGSIDEGINAAAKSIAKNYRAGGGTIAGMAKSYAPVGAANDPRGLNKGWAAGVSGFQQQLATRGDGQYSGTGGFNFMGSGAARGMGMDVQPGTMRDMVTRETAVGKITANKYAADDMAGFINDLHAAGAPLSDYSGVFAARQKRGGRGWSQHAYGNAVDIETGFGHGPDNSPGLYRWAQAHPQEFQAIQDKHHMRNLSSFDWGHFEWSPQARDTAVASARENIDAQMTHRVHGTGDLNVNVNAPPRTHVAASVGGIFNKIRVHRQQQMEPAATSSGMAGPG